MNPEEQKEISSKKRHKPSAKSGNGSGSDSLNQLNKSSSKKENQGRSKGLSKREGSQGKQGNPH